jgi:hypothetical protein
LKPHETRNSTNVKQQKIEEREGSPRQVRTWWRSRTSRRSQPVRRALEFAAGREKELAQESARFADFCQYFERQRMDVPVEIIDQLGRASRLAIPERVEAMKKLNQKLMEYLDNVGQDPGIRQ